MSGRSIGMIFAFGSGLRVAGSNDITHTPTERLGLTFVPAHINQAGKKNSHRCEIPVYVNSHRGGQDGKSSRFDIVVWGDLARKCALTCSPGKALDVLCELSSYDGRVFQDRVALTKPDGTPFTINKVSLTVMRICFGEEGEKFVEAEVAAGWRPPNWNNPAHPDFQLWKNELNRRIALQYTGGDRFGWARVIQPNGRVLTPEELNTQSYNQPAATPMAQPTQTPETVVSNAFGGGAPAAPAAAPAVTQPFGAPGTSVPVNTQPVAPTAPASAAGFGM